MRKEFYIKNKEGQKISVVLYSKTGKFEQQETVIMCHGFTGDKEELYYPVFFPRLVLADYQAVSFDMNGHGKSDGRFIDFTISKAVDDFKTIYDYVESRGVKRIGIIGHSIGGAVCLLVANKIQIQSIILLSPVSQPLFYRHFLTPKESDRRFLANFGFYPRHSYKRGKYYPVGFNFFEDFEKQPLKQEAGAIKKPILIIHAGQDKSVPLQDSQKLYKNFDFDITAFKIIKKADHNFNKRPVYQQVIKLSLDWLNKYLKKRTDEAITVLVRRPDGKILLVKRSQKVGFYPGYWQGVAGFVVKGESFQKTALREIKEELGLPAKNLRYIKISKSRLCVSNNYDRRWRMRWLLFDSVKVKIKLDWEAVDCRWIWPREIFKYKFVPYLNVGLKRLGLI